MGEERVNRKYKDGMFRSLFNNEVKLSDAFIIECDKISL